LLNACGVGDFALEIKDILHRRNAAKAGQRAFVQILGKLYYFQLLENLRRILLDYGQKPTGRANPAFKAPC
jgi:hypothetical protein